MQHVLINFQRNLATKIFTKNMKINAYQQENDRHFAGNFGVITLWTTDYLFSCRFNSFLSSYRFISYYCCSFTGVDSIFLQDISLLCVHGLFR